jgi:hypothetical protein
LAARASGRAAGACSVRLSLGCGCSPNP